MAQRQGDVGLSKKILLLPMISNLLYVFFFAPASLFTLKLKCYNNTELPHPTSTWPNPPALSSLWTSWVSLLFILVVHAFWLHFACHFNPSSSLNRLQRPSSHDTHAKPYPKNKRKPQREGTLRGNTEEGSLLQEGGGAAERNSTF